jgi:dTDP-4-dehydrorhamnose reductase
MTDSTRIALLGSTGQLGTDLLKVLNGFDVIPFGRADFDVLDFNRVRSVLTEKKPDIIVNTTAFHRVDDCETEIGTAFAANALAVLHLARVANDLQAVLVHFSTDYVFDGRAVEPYIELSPAFPLSIYGSSKLAGEFAVRSVAKRHFLIRTCGLYGKAGSRGKGGNFVETMLRKARAGERIQVVRDQVLTPTSTADLARQLVPLMASERYGLYHITNEGSCSWYEFASAIFELAGVAADLSPTTSDLYKTPALRPKYSVLENAALKGAGLHRMLHWRDALKEYLGPPRA